MRALLAGVPPGEFKKVESYPAGCNYLMQARVERISRRCCLRRLNERIKSLALLIDSRKASRGETDGPIDPLLALRLALRIRARRSLLTFAAAPPVATLADFDSVRTAASAGPREGIAGTRRAFRCACDSRWSLRMWPPNRSGPSRSG
jgi:hypothetical protein